MIYIVGNPGKAGSYVFDKNIQDYEIIHKSVNQFPLEFQNEDKIVLIFGWWAIQGADTLKTKYSHVTIKIDED